VRKVSPKMKKHFSMALMFLLSLSVLYVFRWSPPPVWRTVLPTPLRTIWVSPDGTGDGSSRDNPISLSDAIDQSEAGFWISLQPGVYEGNYDIPVAGTPEHPIMYRCEPTGECWFIDEIDVSCDYCVFWGWTFEEGA
jgi:hypothetical protein